MILSLALDFAFAAVALAGVAMAQAAYRLPPSRS